MIIADQNLGGAARLPPTRRSQGCDAARERSASSKSGPRLDHQRAVRDMRQPFAGKKMGLLHEGIAREDEARDRIGLISALLGEHLIGGADDRRPAARACPADADRQLLLAKSVPVGCAVQPVLRLELCFWQKGLACKIAARACSSRFYNSRFAFRQGQARWSTSALAIAQGTTSILTAQIERCRAGQNPRALPQAGPIAGAKGERVAACGAWRQDHRLALLCDCGGCAAGCVLPNACRRRLARRCAAAQRRLCVRSRLGAGARAGRAQPVSQQCPGAVQRFSASSAPWRSRQIFR